MKKDKKIKEDQVIKIKEPKVKTKTSTHKESIIVAIIIAVVLLLSAAIVVYYFCFANNESVATYDGGKITKGEYEMYYSMFAPWLSYYGYETEEIANYIAEKSVLDKIVYKKAVDEEYKLKAEDKKEIDQLFEKEEEVKSIEERGIDPEKLKEIYYKDAVISAYVEDMKAAAKPEDIKAHILKEEGSDADLNIYVTRHILLKFEEKMTDKEKANLLVKAKKLLEKAKAGSDFAKLAKENSEDSSSSDGGKVEIKNNNSVYEEYKNVVLKLKAGQIYGSVVETQAGYHVIKLDSINKEGRLTDDSEKSSYVDSLLSDMQEKSNYKIDKDKINSIAEKLNITLGLAQSESTSPKTDTIVNAE